MTRALNSDYAYTDAMARLVVTLTLLGASYGAEGNVPLNIELTNNKSVASVGVIDLAIGYQTLTAPPAAATNKATLFWMLLPESNPANTVTLKGGTNDTGTPLHLNGLTLLTIPIGQATIGVTVAGAIVPGVRYGWA